MQFNGLRYTHQWTDDDCSATSDKCRYLHADGFPRSSRHDQQIIFSLHEAVDDIELGASELRVAPVALQYFLRRGMRARATASRSKRSRRVSFVRDHVLATAESELIAAKISNI